MKSNFWGFIEKLVVMKMEKKLCLTSTFLYLSVHHGIVLHRLMNVLMSLFTHTKDLFNWIATVGGSSKPML